MVAAAHSARRASTGRAGRPAGGQDAGGEADGDGNAFGQQDEAERRMDGQRRHRKVDELGQADTEKQPNRPPSAERATASPRKGRGWCAVVRRGRPAGRFRRCAR